MNTENHFYFGIVTGSLLALLLWDLIACNLNVFSILALSGGIGGLLPDTLEPPYSRTHRDIYHSFRLLFILSGIASFFLLLFPLWSYNPLGAYSVGLIAGYISHLLSDAITPTGLPR